MTLPTRRVAAGVEYHGGAYCGWQSQRHSPSVQAPVEAALSRVADQPVTVVCAGRTDTGVHATGQVIHFDTNAERSGRSWRLGANSHLPNDIAILWAQEMDNAFHARFSALARSYRYVILNRRTRPASLSGHQSWERRALDVGRMQAAAQALLGEHDFNAYRGQGCQAHSSVRTIQRLVVERAGNEVMLHITANAFLLHMVRNIAGVLIKIGVGDRPIDWARSVLDGRDRRLGGVTAPPAGLTLEHVEYPDVFGIEEKWRRAANAG